EVRVGPRAENERHAVATRTEKVEFFVVKVVTMDDERSGCVRQHLQVVERLASTWNSFCIPHAAFFEQVLERTRALPEQLEFFTAFGDMHCDWKIALART